MLPAGRRVPPSPVSPEPVPHSFEGQTQLMAVHAAVEATAVCPAEHVTRRPTMGVACEVDLINTILLLVGASHSECVTLDEWRDCRCENGCASTHEEDTSGDHRRTPTGSVVEDLKRLAERRASGRGRDVVERAAARVQSTQKQSQAGAADTEQTSGGVHGTPASCDTTTTSDSDRPAGHGGPHPDDVAPVPGAPVGSTPCMADERGTDASASDAGTCPSEVGVSIEMLDSIFRSLVAVDTYVAMVRDGVPNADDSTVTCAAGVRFLEYTRSCEHGLSLIQSRIIKMTNRVSRCVQKHPPCETDIREWERWNKILPPEMASVMLRWMTQVTRTAGLLSKVVGLIFARHDPRATEHELQLVDPVGLVVSTVRTPSTISDYCWILTQGWLGRPTWKRNYAVLWQQFLYIFDSKSADATCSRCILLRGCHPNYVETHHGRQHVICLSKFLPPFPGQSPAQICLSFEANSTGWMHLISQAILSPPTREVELLLSAVHRQTKLEVTMESVIEDRP